MSLARRRRGRWSRRELLRAGVAGILALVAGAVGWRPEAGTRASALRLLGALGWPAPAAAVGRACLAVLADAGSLERALEDLQVELGPQPSPSTPCGLRLAAGTRIRADFEREDVVHVHGWILSRTEARIAALAALASA